MDDEVGRKNGMRKNWRTEKMGEEKKGICILGTRIYPFSVRYSSDFLVKGLDL